MGRQPQAAIAAASSTTASSTTTATLVSDAPQDVVGLAFRLAGRIRQEFAAQMSGERWAAEANLRPGCFGVLRTVERSAEPMSQRDVSERTGIDPSDVVDLVDRLERAGYLRRRRHDRDRRRNVLEVTDRGRTAIRRFHAVSERVDDVILAALPPDDRDTLRRLLVTLVDHWERPG